MFQSEVAEKFKTRVLYSITSSENRDVYDNNIKMYGSAGQATDVNEVQRKDTICCRLAKARLQTHTHNIKLLFLLYSNSCYGNAPQSYSVRT